MPGDLTRRGAEIDAVEYFGQGYPKGGLATFLYYKNAACDYTFHVDGRVLFTTNEGRHRCGDLPGRLGARLEVTVRD